MTVPQQTLPAIVSDIKAEAQRVKSFELRAPAGSLLPPWEPGAHIDLILPSGRIRQYSLCGDRSDLRRYRIAVLLESAGRGGSAEMHADLSVGDELRFAGPRNHFPLVDADSYVFVAGGIGVTPLLPMIRELELRGKKWIMYYGAQSAGAMAFADELRPYGSDRVLLFRQDVDGLLPVSDILTSAPTTTEVYCCGPDGLLAEMQRQWIGLGRPGELRFERFTAGSAAERPLPADDTHEDHPFEVELRRTGVTLTVPADRSMLDVVRDAVPDVLHDCEEGFCASCETRVIEGEPDHRDTVLSPAERAANKTVMICVGRCRGDRLVLDL